MGLWQSLRRLNSKNRTQPLIDQRGNRKRVRRSDSRIVDVAALEARVLMSGSAPTAVDDGFATVHGRAVTFSGYDLVSNDRDPSYQSLSVKSHTTPAHGTLAVDEYGTFTYTPGNSASGPFVGVDSFTYVATNGTTDSAPATVTISVRNAAPEARGNSLSVGAGSSVEVGADDWWGAYASDADGDPLTYRLAGAGLGPAVGHGTLAPRAGGGWTYQPAAGFVGLDRLTFVANDGVADSNPATITFDVQSWVPTTAVDDYFTTVDTTTGQFRPVYVFAQNMYNVYPDLHNSLLANDSNADPSKFRLAGATGGGAATVPTALGGHVDYVPDDHLTYYPPANATAGAIDHFDYTVGDGVAPATVYVSLDTGYSVAWPGLGGHRIQAPHGATRDFSGGDGLLGGAYDPRGGTLSVASVTQPARGQVVLNGSDGSFTYTPAADFRGWDFFTYVVHSTTHGDSQPVGMAVDVTDYLPAATDTHVQAYAGQAQVIDVAALAGDSDGDPLTLMSIPAALRPQHGTLADNGDGTVTYTPAADYAGPDRFTFQFSDGVAGTAYGSPTRTDVVGSNYATAFVDVRPLVTIAATAAGSEDPDPDHPDDGPKPVQFTVTRSGTSDTFTDPLPVSFHVTGGTADWYDFQWPPSAVTIPAGRASATFDIDPADDGQVEGDEEVEITADGSPTGAYGFEQPANPPRGLGLIHDNDYHIVRAEVSFDSGTIKKDAGTGTFEGPQWLDADGDALINNDEASHAYPVLYTRSMPDAETRLTVTPKFVTDKAVHGTFTIHGTATGLSGGQLTFAKTVKVDGGTEITGTMTSTEAIAGTIDDAELLIHWTITDGDGRMVTYGMSADHAYVTGAAANNEYETVLAIGCGKAKGQRPGNAGEAAADWAAAGKQVLDPIWAYFHGNAVRDVAGNSLKYWGVDARGHATVGELLLLKDAQCGGWAEFFAHVLRSQGIDATFTGITVDPVAGPILTVNTASPTSVEGLGFVALAALPGQNNPAPVRALKDHAVVVLGGASAAIEPNTIFDPSYGEKYSGATMFAAQAAWENASVGQVEWRYSDGVTRSFANNPNVNEFNFSADPLR